MLSNGLINVTASSGVRHVDLDYYKYLSVSSAVKKAREDTIVIEKVREDMFNFR